MSNASVLKKSVKTIKSLIKVQTESALTEIAIALLKDALSMRRGWLGFTGNLPKSYAAGIWDSGGRLIGIIRAEDVDSYYKQPVRRRKVGEGEIVWLHRPWEGRERGTEGHVPIEVDNGPDFSYFFLNAFAPDHYPAICICTGAEYSVYLEESRPGANVLSDSAEPGFVKRVGNHVFAGRTFNP